MVRSYFRTSDGVIAAFDLTNLKSFKDVQDWLGQAYIERGHTVPMVIAGNKCDLKEKR